jgi:chorismate synthase
LDAAKLAAGMARRQVGFGRGGRMSIETDAVQLKSGLRFGETTGAPLTLVIENRDHSNWTSVLAPFGPRPEIVDRELHRPRPGHADLVGMLKYEREDARDILERASARETVARVAAGEVFRSLLASAGVDVLSHVLSVGEVKAQVEGLSFDELRSRAEANDLRCADAYDAMRSAVTETGAEGDTLGGVFEVVVRGLPVGLGSSMAPDRKLDGRLAAALLSIPAVKGCEIGPAFENATRRGSLVHDEIIPTENALPRRSTNRAGGLEGGMTTGEPLVLRGAMKPISTLKKPLSSIDMRTGAASEAGFERSDICAVPAAGVIGEAVVMAVLVDALIEVVGGDSLGDLLQGLATRVARMQRRFEPGR